MKYILTVLLIIGFVVACNAQPNTKATFEVGIVNAQPEKSYRFFLEVKQDTSTAQLQEGMDYLNPDVSGLLTTLQNQHTVGDTTFGEVEITDQTYQQFVKGGLVQVDNGTQKYSAMTVSQWIESDMIEPMQAGFFIRRK